METMLQASILTKQIVWAVFILSGAALVMIYFFAGRPKPPAPPVDAVINAAVIKDFLPNRSGDVDKLILQTAGGEQAIHFPPHTAALIMKNFSKGDSITVQIEQRPHGPKAPELVSLQKNDRLLMVKSIQPPPIAATDSVDLHLESFKLQSDDKGNVVSITTQEYFIPLPPHLVKASDDAPKTIEVKGYLRDENAGFVNIHRLRFLKPYSITINNTHYIL